MMKPSHWIIISKKVGTSISVLFQTFENFEDFRFLLNEYNRNSLFNINSLN